MKQLLLFFSLVFLVSCDYLALNPGPTPPSVASTSEILPSLERGTVLYTTHCSSCHGEDGNGTVLASFSIAGLSNILKVVQQGKGLMPAFPNLSNSDITSVELYLATLINNSQEKDGAKLFESNCARCHGDDGSGGNEFQGNIQGYQGIFQLVRDGKGNMPSFSSNSLSDTQIEAIQSFLLTFEAPKNGIEYYKRNCVSCHGASGEGTENGYQIRFPVREYASFVIRNGRSGTPFPDAMPSYTTTQLSNQFLDELLTWLHSFDQPTTGKDLYLTYCGNCHGEDGRGGIVHQGIRGESLNEWINTTRSGEGGANFSNRGRYMPAWNSSQLSNAEIELMRTYVRSL